MRGPPKVDPEKWDRVVAAIGAPPAALERVRQDLWQAVARQWVSQDLRRISISEAEAARRLERLERALRDIEAVRKDSTLFKMATDPLDLAEVRRRIPALRDAAKRDAATGHGTLASRYWSDIAGIYEGAGKRIGTGRTGPFQRLVAECHVLIGLEPPSPDTVRDFVQRRRGG